MSTQYEWSVFSSGLNTTIGTGALNTLEAAKNAAELCAKENCHMSPDKLTVADDADIFWRCEFPDEEWEAIGI